MAANNKKYTPLDTNCSCTFTDTGAEYTREYRIEKTESIEYVTTLNDLISTYQELDDEIDRLTTLFDDIEEDINEIKKLEGILII